MNGTWPCLEIQFPHCISLPQGDLPFPILHIYVLPVGQHGNEDGRGGGVEGERAVSVNLPWALGELCDVRDLY